VTDPKTGTLVSKWNSPLYRNLLYITTDLWFLLFQDNPLLLAKVIVLDGRFSEETLKGNVLLEEMLAASMDANLRYLPPDAAVEVEKNAILLYEREERIHSLRRDHYSASVLDIHSLIA
jgi:hypothetical protein